MSKLFAVLGSPISHSKSPAIHTAAYRVLGEDWQYRSFEVAKGALKRFIESEATEYSGFSLTMPLKENAFDFADETDELSRLTKASNTLIKRDGKWFGYNTDIFGLTQAISLKISATPQHSLILGSGATATSAMVAIASIAPGSSVSVFARNKTARQALVEFGTSLGLSVKHSKFLGIAISKADLTISTLPGGALDEIFDKLSKRKALVPGGLLLDVAYSPWPSKLADFWFSRNQPVVSGLEMLIWQAIAQIRIFRNGSTENHLPNEIAVVEAMRNAVS